MLSFKRRIYAAISKKFMNDCSSYNSLEVRRGCRSKKQARAIFAAHEVPHAQGKIIFGPLAAHNFAKKHGFPLVIKPNVSGFSRGSYFPINSYKELYKALFLAKIWWPTTVIEQYLQGKNYRVVVIDGEIMSAIERFPPTVVGNGVDSIRQLAKTENEIREEMGLFPTIHPILETAQTINHLAKQGLSFNSVPAKGESVTLFYRIALAPGGTVHTIDKATIPLENKELFLKVLKMFNANILGIDIIMEQGIDVPHDQQKCIMLEVNSRPYLKMHDVPRQGNREDLNQYYQKLDNLNISQSDTF
ncbi:MAG: D-alanine-D-alanine ligase-like ATP-grasp enzyme [Oceanospirillaceae bacterium]|jgi:D-alanine-D-alanine ligase-like ATP-grasp enzyme